MLKKLGKGGGLNKTGDKETMKNNKYKNVDLNPTIMIFTINFNGENITNKTRHLKNG